MTLLSESPIARKMLLGCNHEIHWRLVEDGYMEGRKVRTCVNCGKEYIRCIKDLRASQGMGLKEAKAIIDTMVHHDPLEKPFPSLNDHFFPPPS